MTFPDTRPFCGQCGWAPDNSGLGDIGADLICDSCGADLSLYGFTSTPISTGNNSFYLGASSVLTTPHTADLEPATEVVLGVDVEPDDWGDGNILIANGSEVSAAFQVMRTARVAMHADTGFKNLSYTLGVLAGRHAFRVEIDITGVNLSALIDDVEVDTSTSAAATSIPATSDLLAVGSDKVGGNTFPGKYFSAQFKNSIAGADVLGLDCNDAAFPNGPVADGATFVSNGRVWTVNGANVLYVIA